MSLSFVHLRVRTEFSLVDSVVRIKSLVAALQNLEQPACAVSDLHNFFGLVKFYKAAQGAGIKPICAADFLIASNDEDGRPCLLSLYAMNERGYRNLTELISLSYTSGQKLGLPYIQKQWLAEKSDDVIALSGGKFGDIGHALTNSDPVYAKQLAQEYAAIYPGRFYIELQRTTRDGDERYLHQALALADELALPVVASNDVRFLKSSDFEVHEARVCIGEGRTLDDPRRERRYSDQQYLKSSEEMCALFMDIPDALANTIEIAKRCNLDIRLGEYFLPEFPIPEGLTENQFFSKSKLNIKKTVLFC